VIAALSLCYLGCTCGAAGQQAAEHPPAPAQPQDDPSRVCDQGTAITDLRAELHDGDWGHGSIMVYAWIPKPIDGLDAVLDYTTTGGKAAHLEDGIIAHEARSSCGGVVLVGFDIDDLLHVDQGSVTLTDIVYEDGTTEPGPIEVPFELTRIEQEQ
jgi:hypothetical protein